jgi:hypothetical protein
VISVGLIRLSAQVTNSVGGLCPVASRSKSCRRSGKARSRKRRTPSIKRRIVRDSLMGTPHALSMFVLSGLHPVRRGRSTAAPAPCNYDTSMSLAVTMAPERSTLVRTAPASPDQRYAATGFPASVAPDRLLPDLSRSVPLVAFDLTRQRNAAIERQMGYGNEVDRFGLGFA